MAFAEKRGKHWRARWKGPDGILNRNPVPNPQGCRGLRPRPGAHHPVQPVRRPAEWSHNADRVGQHLVSLAGLGADHLDHRPCPTPCRSTYPATLRTTKRERQERTTSDRTRRGSRQGVGKSSRGTSRRRKSSGHSCGTCCRLIRIRGYVRAVRVRDGPPTTARFHGAAAAGTCSSVHRAAIAGGPTTASGCPGLRPMDGTLSAKAWLARPGCPSWSTSRAGGRVLRCPRGRQSSPGRRTCRLRAAVGPGSPMTRAWRRGRRSWRTSRPTGSATGTQRGLTRSARRMSFSRARWVTRCPACVGSTAT